MSRVSAGLLLYRDGPRGLEVLLVHPGGPFFAKRDLGAWSIPKGEIEEGEDLLAAARRELVEETGFTADGPATAPLIHAAGSSRSYWLTRWPSCRGTTERC